MAQDSGQAQIGKLVGARLKEARLAQHMTQGQLAQEDFSVSYISAIERGQIHPSLRAMEIFAQRLGLSSKDLLIAPPKERGPVGLVAMSAEEEFDWQLLEAAVLVCQGAIEQAIQLLQELSAKRSLLPTQKSYALYLLALANIKLNELPASEQLLAEASRLLKDDNSLLALHILNTQGIVHSLMNHHGQSMALFQQCREKLETKPELDANFTAEIYSHLGQHYLDLDRNEDAVTLFEKTLHLTQADEPGQQIERYMTTLQQCIGASERLQATLTAYKILHILAAERNQALYRSLFHQLGHALMQGDGEQARLYLEGTLRETPRDLHVQASAHVHMAAWQLERSEIEEAKKHAQQAMSLFDLNGASIIAADAALVSGKIEYAQKHYKAGDAFFERGLAILEQLHEREELADQSAQYAQLLEDRGDMHRAVALWKKAFEWRQRVKR